MWKKEFNEQNINNFFTEYVVDLLNKENKGAEVEQLSLYSAEDYVKLLKPVLDKILRYSTKNLYRIRAELHKESCIEDLVSQFVYNRGMTPGVVLSYSIPGLNEVIVAGNKKEYDLSGNRKKYMKDDTIFDLAAVSTLFTQVSILKLYENGLIDLDAKVTEYVPEFKNLNNVTIMDILSFTTQLKTDGRIDRAADKEEAKKILMGIKADPDGKSRPYSDLAPMVLRVVVEEIVKMPIYDYLKSEIFSKLKMRDTYVVVPKYKLYRVASTNFSCNYYKDGYKVRKDSPSGVVFDPKAQKMGQLDGVFSGHAGLFSTARDMITFANAMSNYEILNKETIDTMSKNRTGKPIIDANGNISYTQYCGPLGYSKNPDLPNSEIYHALSSNAFANAGYNGTQLTIDPENKINLFVGGNRVHNRMTFIDPSKRALVKEDDMGKKTIILPSGVEMIDATRFAWDRDAFLVHPALKLAIQYKFLDDFYKYFSTDYAVKDVKDKSEIHVYELHK